MRQSFVYFVLTLVLFAAPHTARAAIFFPFEASDDIGLYIQPFDTGGRYGLFPTQIEAPYGLSIFTLPPDPEYLRTYPFLRFLDRNSNLPGGTPLVFDTEIPHFGCLLGTFSVGLNYRSSVTRDPYIPVVMVPLNPDHEGAFYEEPEIYNYEYTEYPDALALNTTFMLADSLVDPCYAVDAEVLPVSERNKTVSMQLWVGDEPTTPTFTHQFPWTDRLGRIERPQVLFGPWHYDFPAPTPPDAFVVTYGPEFPPEPGIKFYIADTYTSDTIRLKFSIPGYHDMEITNIYEVGNVYFPTFALVPDGGPDSGPSIGELPTTEAIGELLLTSSLLQSCDRIVSFNPDRNGDRISDAADLLAP